MALHLQEQPQQMSHSIAGSALVFSRWATLVQGSMHSLQRGCLPGMKALTSTYGHVQAGSSENVQVPLVDAEKLDGFPDTSHGFTSKVKVELSRICLHL